MIMAQWERVDDGKWRDLESGPDGDRHLLLMIIRQDESGSVRTATFVELHGRFVHTYVGAEPTDLAWPLGDPHSDGPTPAWTSTQERPDAPGIPDADVWGWMAARGGVST